MVISLFRVADNSRFGVLNIPVIDDDLLESNENVILRLEPSQYPHVFEMEPETLESEIIDDEYLNAQIRIDLIKVQDGHEQISSTIQHMVFAAVLLANSSETVNNLPSSIPVQFEYDGRC